MANDNRASKETEELLARLTAPFPDADVKFLPKVVNGESALALAYVDARAIQDRLDDVLGAAGWEDEYQMLEDGGCLCKLSLRIGGPGKEWVSKMDVGSPSEQKDPGDRTKASVSDALKRAAVKFGIGRYLYRLEAKWHPYDAKSRQFKTKPPIPRPRPAPAKPAAAARVPNDLVDRIDMLAKELGHVDRNDPWLAKVIQEKLGKSDVFELDAGEARRLVEWLEKNVASKKSKKPAA